MNVARRLGAAGAQGVGSLNGQELNSNEADGQKETNNLGVAFHDLSKRVGSRLPLGVSQSRREADYPPRLQ